MCSVCLHSLFSASHDDFATSKEALLCWHMVQQRYMNCSIMLDMFMHGFMPNPIFYPSVRQGITGAFRPGVLTALMGASGAGKTTLMDVLADRKTGALVSHVCLGYIISTLSLCYVIMLLACYTEPCCVHPEYRLVHICSCWHG